MDRFVVRQLAAALEGMPFEKVCEVGMVLTSASRGTLLGLGCLCFVANPVSCCDPNFISAQIVRVSSVGWIHICAKLVMTVCRHSESRGGS